MGLVVLVNSDTEVRNKVKRAFEDKTMSGYTVKMISKEEKALESLNFDLPEVVIINCADDRLNYQRIIEEAKKDAWLHSFGVICIYDGEVQDEQNIAKDFLDLNLLAMLDKPRIVSHLFKSISIILENRQLVFQRELASRLSDRSSGSFEIENDTLAVPIYSGLAVTNLVQRGYLKPEKKMYLQLALSELVINGIEHGNCGVTYEEKTAKMEEGMSVVDIIMEKCQDPEVNARKIHFSWESEYHHSTFVIRDDGEGFDVSNVREKASKDDDLATHGRGISLAEAFCDKLYYNDKGNEVTIVINHEAGAEKTTPEGFSQEEALYPAKGDVIFEDGERGDFLYYISSGRFKVIHQGRQVGTLTPADVFMGEMSFLLNNRRSARVVADNEEGKLIRVPRSSFVRAMKDYPHYGIFLSKLLAHKLARSNVQRTMSSG